MAKKKTEPKVIETIRKKDVPLATKRKAIAEARLIAKKGLADFNDNSDIGCFAWWKKTPSGHNFWSEISRARSKTA